VKNGLGLLGTISKIRLDSELSEIVSEGKDKKIAEFTINSYSDYKNALKQIRFYDKKNRMREFLRDFKYKYKVPGTKEVENDKTCTGIYGIDEVCTYVDGKPTKVIDYPTWIELDKRLDFKEGEKITIGIFMDVVAGERIEWIPTFFGVEIVEWAEVIVVVDHSLTLDTNSGATSQDVGTTIIPRQTIELVSVTQHSDNEYDTCAILEWATNATLAVSTFSGSNCTFSPYYELQASTKYNIIVNQTSGSPTPQRKDSAGYDINTTYVDFYRGYRGDGGGGDTMWVIELLTIDTAVASGETGLIEPVNYANLSSSSVLLNASANYTSEKGHGVINMTLWLNNNINTTITNSTAQQNLTLGTNLDFADGFYSWIVQAGMADGTSYNSSNWSFTIDTTLPVVDIISPSTTETYGVSGETEYVNWTVSDTNLDSCIVNYNGSNSTVVCADLNDSFVLVDGVYTATVWANDTVNNWGFDTQTWSYEVFETSNTYEASVVESSSNNFDIGLNYTSTDWNNIAANIWYNNTKYAATKIGSGNSVNFTRNITAPPVGTARNKSFHWEVNLINVTGTYSHNSSSVNQLVSPINVSICGHPHTVPYINFTIYDEETLVETNGTIELTFTYRGVNALASSAKTFSFSNTTGNESRYSFCFNPADQNYTVDSILQYTAPGYTNKFYNFEGIVFSNVTTEAGLYLLDSDNSTSFIIEVKDENYQALTGVEVYIQRYYPNINTWYTLEIVTTDNEGETVQHIYTEDALYRFKIYDNGELQYTSIPKLIICPEQPCTVKIVLSKTLPSSLQDFEELEELVSSLNYDSSTHQVTFTYTDTSGNFTQARLYVIRRNMGTVGIGHSCNITSTSDSAALGGVNCDLTSSTNGTYIATGYIRRGGNEIIIERNLYSKERDVVGALGTNGILLGFFFLIGIVMLGVYRPSLGIIFCILGIFLLQLLHIMDVSVTFLVAIIGIGAIILLEIRKQ